jgi:hypothetical protein
MNFKWIITGTVCFILGGLMGSFFSSKSGGHSEQGLDQTAYSLISGTKHPRFGQDWGGVGMSKRTTTKPGHQRTDDSMILVPISLLKSLSIAKSNYTIGQPILDDNDPIEAALGLSSSEKERIHNSWENACEHVREIEIKSMTTKDLDDGSMLLSLPNLSKQRREIADQFMNSVTQTLGAERGGAFNATKQVNSRFASESGQRSIAVKIEPAGDGQWSYKMSLEDATGSRVWVGESIPEEIRHLADAAGILPTIEEVVDHSLEE